MENNICLKLATGELVREGILHLLYQRSRICKYTWIETLKIMELLWALRHIVTGSTARMSEVYTWTWELHLACRHFEIFSYVPRGELIAQSCRGNLQSSFTKKKSKDICCSWLHNECISTAVSQRWTKYGVMVSEYGPDQMTCSLRLITVWNSSPIEYIRSSLATKQMDW
jgi:hypothetical protein